jgi:hypothetical protein
LRRPKLFLKNGRTLSRFNRASSYKLSEENIQMVRDGAYRRSLTLVDDEDLEEGLSGIAEITRRATP